MDEIIIKNAVKHFWQVRANGTGVLGGKTLDGFIEIIEQVIKDSGLENAEIHTGKNTSQLPGYFRPHKSWDVVVTDNGQLIAAIELKSQVGSIGNNFNNRTEEVLGSGIDLYTAIEEEAFGSGVEIFTGYLILVEESTASLATPKIGMKYFPVMKGFLLDENGRGSNYKKQTDGSYPRIEGISYINRYDLMCKKLMFKKLYTAASLVTAKSSDASTGDYKSISNQTSIISFLTKLSNHCSLIASYQKPISK